MGQMYVCLFVCRNPLYMAGMKVFGDIKTTFSGAKTFNFDSSRTPFKNTDCGVCKMVITIFLIFFFLWTEKDQPLII